MAEVQYEDAGREGMGEYRRGVADTRNKRQRAMRDRGFIEGIIIKRAWGMGGINTGTRLRQTRIKRDKQTSGARSSGWSEH
jgi:hypothetical protein